MSDTQEVPVTEEEGEAAPVSSHSLKSIVRETLTSLGLLPSLTPTSPLADWLHESHQLNLKGSQERQLSDGSSLLITKDSLTGLPRLTFWVSNNFRDNDNPPEILTAKAHQEFIAWASKEGHQPEAWLWHTPGTKWGTVDWMDYFDGFLVESVLADKGMEHTAMSLAADPDLRVSHGFQILERNPVDWSLIESYRQFEISPLPAGKEANSLTGCANLDLTPLMARVTDVDGDLLKENTDMMNPEKRKWLVDKLGEDKVVGIEGRTLDLAEVAKGLGLEAKEISDALGMTETAPAPVVPISVVPEEFRALATPADSTTSLTPAIDIKALADEVAARIDTAGLQTFLKDIGTRLATLEAGQFKAIGDAIRPPAGDAAAFLWSSRPTASPSNVITKEASEALGGPRSDDSDLPAHMKEIREMLSPALNGSRAPGPDAPKAI